MSSQSETRLLSGPEMSDLLDQLAANIVQSHNGQTGLTLIGIQRGGAHLARRLKERLDKNLKTSLPLGIIDINLYRDDWTRSSIKPRVGKTEIPFSIDNKDVLLIDDVLYTGRTVRAAMDALIDFGRPRRIELLVFVDRGHRELPIAPDFVGLVTETDRDDLVNVYLQEQDGRDEVALLRKSD
ncbi:MAG: bifunctional pyr operon transcriptional regulator/uracil phosphoribosyltransferase PyrR [Deltaproteobacteria bacterium]|nr:bifunctional pyr operon transcriptional regulator/uracil phosphoribosyltransferase PyrR [Deltaproteobacteria bacterium]